MTDFELLSLVPMVLSIITSLLIAYINQITFSILIPLNLCYNNKQHIRTELIL